MTVPTQHDLSEPPARRTFPLVAPEHITDRSGRLWLEEGETAVGPVASVAPIPPIDKLYSFRVPAELAGNLSAGQRVAVPLGKRDRLTPGFCVAIDQRPWSSTLKSVHSLIDAQSFLTEELLELGRWIARYYACPLGRALSALVPEAVRRQSGFCEVRLIRLARPLEQIEAEAFRLGAWQRAILKRLAGQEHPVECDELLNQTGAPMATLYKLRSHGWIAFERVRRPRETPVFDSPGHEPDFTLNASQQAVLSRIQETIDRGVFHVTLLYGVSGSGKTEVYIRAMRHVLALGRQVILLVPEIALTTQLVHRLASRFTKVAVIHSGLTGANRSLTWSAIRSGERQVIIGTRSAVFAPCPALGLIVVDEEQDGSYKNLQAPRFHVRDVAIKRAQQRSIPVILGSATPSLETWRNCTRLGHYDRLDLPRRVRNLPMPKVIVVDMRDEYKEGRGFPVLSHVLEGKLGETLARGEQAVVLMNRRGFANWLFCPTCKLRVRCPNCDANMVFHAAGNEIICHYCSRRMPWLDHCPNVSCGATLLPVGAGTQRVEQRLSGLWPEARLARVDSDTMRHEREYRRLVAAFEARQIDVLIGTQMVAKGLDFPFVSLVGVIGADTALVSPDFRAAERLFQLVTQVAGRAGRGSVPGEVVVQTLAPDMPALAAAAGHDYEAFVTDEMALRQKIRYPPFARLARLVLSGRREPSVKAAARELTDNVRGAIADLKVPSVDILGPHPCILTRLRGAYRYEVLVRCPSAPVMLQVFDRLRATEALKIKGATVVVDVDPVSLT